MDLSEAEHPIAEYESFGELFVRRLSPGARPIDPAPVVSPVDGLLSELGETREGRLIQAKGIDYSLAELLDDASLARRLTGGAFFTLYLRPRDYHRIHTPVGGRVRGDRRVPGRLFPVKPYMVRNQPGLFSENERLVIELESEELGAVAVVCVAAAGVGTITACFATGETPSLQKGDELAAFNLGSTVIVLFERARVVAADGIRAGQELRVGQPLAARDGAAGVPTA
jgi:phosphatidylserine decarboxylase